MGIFSNQKNYNIGAPIEKCRAAIRLSSFYQGAIKNEIDENYFKIKNIVSKNKYLSSNFEYSIILNLEEKTQNLTTVNIQVLMLTKSDTDTEESQTLADELILEVWNYLSKSIYENFFSENDEDFLVENVSKNKCSGEINTVDTTKKDCNPHKISKKPITICLFIILSVIIFIGYMCNSLDNSQFANRKDSDAISAAKQIVSMYLKDPSSAKYNDAYVEDKDDYGRYIIYIDVSAINGFGGATRERYHVPLRLGEGKTFFYSTVIPYYDANAFSLSFIKEINDWNEDPAKESDVDKK